MKKRAFKQEPDIREDHISDPLGCLFRLGKDPDCFRRAAEGRYCAAHQPGRGQNSIRSPRNDWIT